MKYFTAGKMALAKKNLRCVCVVETSKHCFKSVVVVFPFPLKAEHLRQEATLEIRPCSLCPWTHTYTTRSDDVYSTQESTMCVDDVFHVTCWTSAHEQLTGCGCRQNGERFNNAHSHVMKESKKNKKLCRIYLLKLFLLSFLLREIKLSVFVLWTKHTRHLGLCQTNLHFSRFSGIL